MKILFTANRFPYPPFRGDKLKIFNLASRLAGKHTLHLVTFIQDESDRDHLPELEKIFSEIHLVPLRKLASGLNVLSACFRREPFQVRYFHSPAMRDMIEELKVLHDYDVVHVQHLRMAQYWDEDARIPRILDLPDAYSLYWKRRTEAASGLAKVFARIEQARVARYERVIRKFDLSLVCSIEDQAYLQRHLGLDNIGLLPNGVDMRTFCSEGHDYAQDKVLLFTGNMDYAPNVDAVTYFAQEIFPLILEQVPAARFVIAGQRPVKKVTQLASDRIEVTGFVPELKHVYARAAVLVAPLRFGAGTQNKVLEAMAMGVPVVSRDIGFNGLGIKSGEGAILAMDARSFANECIALLGSESMRRQVGLAGSQVVAERFDWDKVAQRLEAFLKQAIESRASKGL